MTTRSESSPDAPLSPSPDWTVDPKTGRSNSSEKFSELVAEVQRLIRSEAFQLISGNHEPTARLIMAQLAHVHKLSPLAESAPQARRTLKTNLDWQAKTSLIAKAKRLETDPDYDWDDISDKYERHAINAVLDLVEAEKELSNWATWGIVEIAVRNPSVADYCKHWEERAEKAEKLLAESAPQEARVRDWKFDIELVSAAGQAHGYLCATNQSPVAKKIGARLKEVMDKFIAGATSERSVPLEEKK